MGQVIGARFLERASNWLNLIKPEDYFLIVGVFFGALFLFITPPVAGLDEEQHFYRAYQISELNFLSDRVSAPNVYGEAGQGGYGGYMSREVAEDVNKLRNSMNLDRSYIYETLEDVEARKYNTDVKIPVRFDNTAIYSPLAYMPQALGMMIGKVFNSNAIGLSYLGRIMTLLFCIGLIYTAIRILPIGKWVYVVLALNPGALFLISSLSADAVSIASVALFTAMSIAFALGKLKATNKGYTLLLLCGVFMALQKNAYLPVLLLTLLIPGRVISLRLKLLLLAVAWGIGIAWNLQALSITPFIPEYFSIDQHISASEQLKTIISNPLKFVAIIMWGIFGMPSLLVNANFVGFASDTTLPFWTIVLWYITAVTAALTLSVKQRSKQLDRIHYWFLGIGLLSFGALLFSIYIGWSPVGSREITGIQGRYLIPISFLLLPTVVYFSDRIKVVNFNAALFTKLSLIIILLASVVTVYIRYVYGIY